MDLILDFFLVGGIVIIAIILLRLLRIKSKELPQKILILLFLLLFFVAVYFYALLHNINWLIKLCFFPNDITKITLGPLLFLYVKSLFLKEDNLVKNMLPHFIPTLLFAFGITIPTLLYTSFKIDVFSYALKDFIFIFFRIESFYFILYLIISLQLLSKYQKLTKYKYSNLTKFDFNWIKIMLLSTLGIISVDLVLKIYESFFGDFQWNVDNISVLAMIVLVSYLAYYGVNQSKVLLPTFLLYNEIEPEINKKKKKTIPSDKKEEFVNLKNKLELIIKTEQPYLDEDLTLGKLAKQLSTTDKKLSTMLNQYLNTTFYDLINKYRVEEVKVKINLDSYKNYNLFGIASECGFKSRTSFNRIFKKETGLSPSEFKKSIS
ncbi:helix-turn-helix domain-containing protein [uncultured Winogradskyella sp.]|uniref:helix-turn-helix domain-containing protein n=1 Tax=uncultured Winogradskyella sp. TaxID=395353 RepID=UPI002603FADF|nr:helix-turn-helix domain-containing protein [uncultured Winogradskyella sp.]